VAKTTATVDVAVAAKLPLVGASVICGVGVVGEASAGDDVSEDVGDVVAPTTDGAMEGDIDGAMVSFPRADVGVAVLVGAIDTVGDVVSAGSSVISSGASVKAMSTAQACESKSSQSPRLSLSSSREMAPTQFSGNPSSISSCRLLNPKLLRDVKSPVLVRMTVPDRDLLSVKQLSETTRRE